MGWLVLVSALALLALGCGGAGEGSGAVGELAVTPDFDVADVYAIDLESGEERPIGPAAQYAGSWSPSGTKVATYGPEGDGTLVTSVGTGAKARFDATCHGRVWAPDETMLACGESDPWMISTLDLKSGELRALTDYPSDTSTAPAWSPDSQSIAYLADGALVVMARDGSGKHRVATASSDQPSGPVWSPDGERIGYVHHDALWVVDARGGDRSVLLDGGGRQMHSPAWSPDGRFIAVTLGDGDYEIVVVDAATGELRKLTDNERVNDVQPVWSPDSRHVVYSSDGEGDAGGLLVVPVDGGSPGRVSGYAVILHWFPATRTG